MRARPTRPLLFTMICWFALATACASNDLTGPQPVPEPDDAGGATRDAGDPPEDAEVTPDAAPDAEADVAVVPECTGDAQCPPGSFCDTAQLECVTDCANDEGCADPLVCDITRGRCIDAPETCGDGACVAADGEDCVTCAADCACEANESCSDGMCIALCGDSMCVAADGEDCDTCAADCACNGNESCNAGACEADCGDGFCDAQAGEDCGTCGADCGCDSANKCVANSCIPRCGDGLCEASENCESCPQDCGCDAGQRCQDSMCVCADACSNGDTDCVGNAERACVADINGCYDYGAAVTCPSGICTNGSCCTPQCGNQECGSNGCGGNCGTCTFACAGDNNCTRRLFLNSVEIRDCDVCDDPFNNRSDPRFEVIIGTDTYGENGPDNRCDPGVFEPRDRIVGGAAQTFTKTQLESVKVRVLDRDGFPNGADDLCAEWEDIDVSVPGTIVLVSPGNKVRVTLTTSL